MQGYTAVSKPDGMTLASTQGETGKVRSMMSSSTGLAFVVGLTIVDGGQQTKGETDTERHGLSVLGDLV